MAFDENQLYEMTNLEINTAVAIELGKPVDVDPNLQVEQVGDGLVFLRRCKSNT